MPANDIRIGNIVMDASTMVPGGFRFMRPQTYDGRHHLDPYTGDDSVPNTIKSRTQAPLVKYYHIDFGLSVRFASYDTCELVTRVYGRLRKHIPEISETVPYDPFKEPHTYCSTDWVDIRLVGEMLQTEFLMEYVGPDFLIPFIRTTDQREDRMALGPWPYFSVRYRS
ncbi:hypothetical protein B0H11DRAFT_2191118 [Mycena galericulata]|nr:hypothetical protein B0H11DRAFT_2191118 [Mycena galericulata]